MHGTQAGESTLEAVVGSVTDGDVLVMNGAGSFPLTFSQALAARASELRDVEVVHPMRREPGPLEPDYLDVPSESIRHVSEFVFDDAVRTALEDRRVAYRPNHPHEEASSFAERCHDQYDVICRASAPDRDGTVSLGPFGGWILPWIRSPRCRKLMLEIHPDLPQIQGATRVPLSSASAWFHAVGPVSVEPSGSIEPSGTELRIAEHIVDLIPQRATLQFGAGGVPNAVARLLADSDLRGLGLHSEGFFAPMVDLIDRGVVDNGAKNVHRGQTVCALALGDQRVYDALGGNPAIAMMSIHETNDPQLIAQNDRMIAVNATLQLDLHGQCASETLGFRHYSGTGGQWEFSVGATRSKGGRSIVVVPSTARQGSVSTIVPGLTPGAAVTIPRNDVDTVVTEWGVAELRGRTTPERARALISIAHPDFREELMRDAREHRFI